MIANATSVQKYNLQQVDVGEFLLQLPELRHMAESPWCVKGKERKHSVVKFGGLFVNYFAGVKNNPSCLYKEDATLLNKSRMGCSGFWTSIRPIPQCKILALVVNRHYPIMMRKNKRQTQRMGDPANYQVTKYDTSGGRTVASFRDKEEDGRRDQRRRRWTLGKSDHLS